MSVVIIILLSGPWRSKDNLSNKSSNEDKPSARKSTSSSAGFAVRGPEPCPGQKGKIEGKGDVIFDLQVQILLRRANTLESQSKE